MNYELFQQGPAVYIPVILVSLVVTIFAYGMIPFIVARKRKKMITRKKYNRICYGYNVLIMLVFLVINGASSGAPYLLWTSVFASNGRKTLMRRGLLKDYKSDDLEDDPNRLIECKSCGYRSKEYYGACPKCGHQAIQYVLDDQASKSFDKVCFCRMCGDKLADGSKFCSKCGTQVVEIPQ